MKKILLILSVLLISQIAVAFDTPAACGGGRADLGTAHDGGSDPDPVWTTGQDIVQATPCPVDYPHKFTEKIGLTFYYYCLSTCTCGSGQHEIETPVVDQNGQTVRNTSPKHLCVADNANTSSASSSSQAACANGLTRDANGGCSGCSPPQVQNFFATGSATVCENKTDCTYPALYSSFSNSCLDNSENCAVGAHHDIINGGCSAYGDTSCPAGWKKKDASGLHCEPDAAAASSANSGTATSTPSTATSAPSTNPSSSGTATSAPSGKPPYTSTDNTSPNQDTSSSGAIPAGLSKAECLQTNSAAACTAMENCQLTFGVGQCVGMSATQNCPNSYTINGQKICVFKGASGSASSTGSGTASGNSGSAASASKGECDPTAKSYDECMGRNKTPDGTVTAKIKSDLETAANKALDDYTKSRNEDLDNTKRDGIDFKSAPDSLKSSVLALIPSYRTCQNVTFTFFKTTKTLDCALFEKFKLIMAWFCSIATAIYIFKLALKPVEK